MVAYVVLFGAVSTLLWLFGYTGLVYGIIALALALTWIAFALYGFSSTDERRWAKRVFLFSLIVLTVLCATWRSTPALQSSRRLLATFPRSYSARASEHSPTNHRRPAIIAADVPLYTHPGDVHGKTSTRHAPRTLIENFL